MVALAVPQPKLPCVIKLEPAKQNICATLTLVVVVMYVTHPSQDSQIVQNSCAKFEEIAEICESYRPTCVRQTHPDNDTDDIDDICDIQWMQVLQKALALTKN